MQATLRLNDSVSFTDSLAKNARDLASRSTTSFCEPRRHDESRALSRNLINRSNWCTGKDSNLRTSLGGTDLQSVGFNHSPTCATLPGMQPSQPHPAGNLVASRCAANAQENAAAHSRFQLRIRASANLLSRLASPTCFSQSGKTKIHANGYRAKTTARRKSSEWSAFGKTCCAAYRVPAACRKFVVELRILELAKGFEPPTL
jgi:hypothetical protein